ncbi:hypothetical protein C8R43DRAFT_1112755 [Mycena crocata]|nr:hypothetical protein C8R43DRAFT_1112755 [Mycena crocata]
MSRENSLVNAPAVDEHASMRPLPPHVPQFSANLFAGPCFGDLSPSESLPASLPDAPSPSPLLLNSFLNSSSVTPRFQQTENLIDFNIDGETVSDNMLALSSHSCNELHDLCESTVSSSIDASAQSEKRSQFSAGTAVEFSSSPSSAIAHSVPVLPTSKSSECISSASMSLDEPSLPELSRPFNADANLLLLSSLGENQFSQQTHFADVSENDGPDVTSPGPSSPYPSPAPFAETIETPTTILPLDLMSQKTVDMTVSPSSSPMNAPTPSLPLTASANSNSQLSAPLNLSSEQSSSPLTPENSSPKNSSVNNLLSSETIVFATSERDCSSPPSSSPGLVFSSSPPAQSDSSVFPEDLDSAVSKYEFDAHAMVSLDLPPSSSPLQHSSLLMIPSRAPSPLNQDDFIRPPPSSSPSRSSSPQSMEPIEFTVQYEIADDLSTFFHSPSMEIQGPEPSDVPTSNHAQQEDVQILSLPEASKISFMLDGKAVPLELSADDSNRQNDSSRKRKREEEENMAPHSAPRNKTRKWCDLVYATQPPNPKRPTLAAQKLQRKTLAKPFRSPAMKTLKAPEPVMPPPPKKELATSLHSINDSEKKKKHRTQRAAGQFKSPLSLAASSSIPSSVRQTPTIQALERRVQVLKRAVKIRKDGEEQTLDALVKKWTEAGREVAWEVWGLVKDNETGSGDSWGKEAQDAQSGKRRFEDSWGWGADSGSKRMKVEETAGNWGWDTSPAVDNDDHSAEQRVESIEEAEDKPRDTLGTMLMRLGIAPSTLGWDDEAGEFVDE